MILKMPLYLVYLVLGILISLGYLGNTLLLKGFLFLFTIKMFNEIFDLIIKKNGQVDLKRKNFVTILYLLSSILCLVLELESVREIEILSGIIFISFFCLQAYACLMLSGILRQLNGFSDVPLVNLFFTLFFSPIFLINYRARFDLIR